MPSYTRRDPADSSSVPTTFVHGLLARIRRPAKVASLAVTNADWNAHALERRRRRRMASFAALAAACSVAASCTESLRWRNRSSVAGNGGVVSKYT